MSSYDTARSGNFPLHILFNPSPNNKDLFVREISYLRHPHQEHCPHNCKGFCIHYILSGKGRSWDNGEWIEVGPGDATICRSGEEHSMECLGDEPCTYLAVVITY